MKRLLFFCLTTILSIATWGADFQVDGLYYNISSADEQTCSVTYTGNQKSNSTYSGDIVIPETVDYNGTTYTVVGIGNYAFYNGTNITSVSISTTVTSIGMYGFYGCSALTSVVLPEGLTTTGMYMFQSCTSLTEMTIPEGVTSLSGYSFSSCTSLSRVELPAGLESIGSHTFEKCTSLTEMTIPDAVTSIGSYAFDGCTKLETVNIPSEVESISQYTFRNCSSLKEIVVPNAASSIGNYAFYGCTSLVKASIGSHVSSVGNNAFYNCSSLESLTSMNETPPTVSASNTFTNVPTSTCVLYVPTQSIEAYQTATYWSVFTNIEGLGYAMSIQTLEATDLTASSATLNAIVQANGNVILEQGFDYWVTSGGEKTRISGEVEENMSAIVTNLSPSTSYTYYAYARTESGYEYGPEVTFTTEIYDFVYDGMRYVITSSEEKTVQTTYSGSQARGLTSYSGDIVVPETVEYGDVVYTVTGIGDCTFYYGMENITSITLPNTLTAIGEMAFFQDWAVKELVIPDGITRIEEYTFNYCLDMVKVNIPDGVTYIGSNAFNYCTSLPELTIPDGVTYIGQRAFNACSSLVELTIPDGITSIEPYTFNECTSLKKINLPATITSIGHNAFEACTSLTEFSFPESVTEIGTSAFYGCSALKEITIPEKVTNIDTYTFGYCTSLTDVSLPDGITEIGASTFYGCTSLPEIIIPQTVASLGQGAFGDCTALVRVYSFNTTPPECKSGVFTGGVFTGIDESCVLLVQKEAIEDYAVADTWQDFLAIMSVNDPVVTTIDATNLTKETATLNGCVVLKEMTDEIMEQGFEYWTNDNDVKSAVVTDIDGDYTSTLIIALTEGNTYTYRSYAKTENDTFYGNEIVFSTANRNADFYLDGLFYVYATDGGTCEVTFKDTNYNTYSGAICVPETTLYNDVEYTVVGIGESAFRNSAMLTEVTIPSTAQSIGIWAFTGCESLTEVIIPDAVTEIGNQAFNGCEGLVSVVIGGSVETIGNNSFNCSNLMEINSLNPVPPLCNLYAFRSVDKSACVLTVPEGSEEAYAAADAWKEFFPSDDTTGIGSMLSDEKSIEGYYSIGGQRLNTPQRGVNIVRYIDGTTKKILIK